MKNIIKIKWVKTLFPLLPVLSSRPAGEASIYRYTSGLCRRLVVISEILAKLIFDNYIVPGVFAGDAIESQHDEWFRMVVVRVKGGMTMNDAGKRVNRTTRRALTWIAALALALSGLSLPVAAEQKPGTPGDSGPNAAAFRQMKHGLFITQTYGLTVSPPGTKIATFEEFANAFDVKEFADQMESIGVEYVYFTAWHKSIYCLAPIKAIEKWLPGHTCRRDLLGEIADALQKKNIKLVIYAHPNDAHDLTPEEQARVGFSTRGQDKNQKYNDFVNEVFVELTERYCKRPNVLGYWWDSWWHNGGPIDMPRLCKTVRTIFPGVITLSNKHDPRYIDFLSGEGGRMGSLRGMVATKDNLTWYLGGDWWNNNPGTTISITPEDMYRFLLLNVGTGAPGGMSWALSPLADGKTWGANNQPLKVMQELNRLIAPVRPTICGVLPSGNWRITSAIDWEKAPAFVAARSPDNQTEYVHVMKAPADRFIDLPKPVDTFKAARMYVGKHPVAMTVQGDSLRLTLPEGENWGALDTVIELAIKR